MNILLLINGAQEKKTHNANVAAVNLAKTHIKSVCRGGKSFHKYAGLWAESVRSRRK